MEYQVEDRESGNWMMGKFATYAEAEKEVERQEDEDRQNGNYMPDYYFIREVNA